MYATIGTDDYHIQLQIPAESFDCEYAQDSEEVSNKRRMQLTGARAGDILLDLDSVYDDEAARGGDPGGYDIGPITRFCLILRQGSQGIFEIVGEAQLCGMSFARAEYTGRECLGEHSPVARRFTLYLSAKDAIAYVLRNQAGVSGPWQRACSNPGSNESYGACRRFYRERFSSFAILKMGPYPARYYHGYVNNRP